MILNGNKLLEFLPLVELYTTYKDHERLQVFALKGRKCVTCYRTGTLLVVSTELKGKRAGEVHIDLVTDDFVLMTVDHVNPISISGDDTIDNKQPMCLPCNESKGCKQITNEQLALNRKNARPMLAGIEIIRQLVPNIHRLNGDLAGKAGVEPTITGPKPVALPIGYFPLSE